MSAFILFTLQRKMHTNMRGMQLSYNQALADDRSTGAGINPSNAEATFVQSTRKQRFLKIILTLSCWYSLDSSLRVLSDEYPFARVSVIFQFFLHYFVLAKLATSSIGLNVCTVCISYLSSSWCSSPTPLMPLVCPSAIPACLALHALYSRLTIYNTGRQIMVS